MEAPFFTQFGSALYYRATQKFENWLVKNFTPNKHDNEVLGIFAKYIMYLFTQTKTLTRQSQPRDFPTKSICIRYRGRESCHFLDFVSSKHCERKQMKTQCRLTRLRSIDDTGERGRKSDGGAKYGRDGRRHSACLARSSSWSLFS